MTNPSMWFFLDNAHKKLNIVHYKVPLFQKKLKVVAEAIDTNTVQSKEKEPPKKRKFLGAGLLDSEDEAVIEKKGSWKVKVMEIHLNGGEIAGRSILWWLAS